MNRFRVGRKKPAERLELRRDQQKAKSKELIAELKPQIVEQVKAAQSYHIKVAMQLEKVTHRGTAPMKIYFFETRDCQPCLIGNRS